MDSIPPEVLGLVIDRLDLASRVPMSETSRVIRNSLASSRLPDELLSRHGTIKQRRAITDAIVLTHLAGRRCIAEPIDLTGTSVTTKSVLALVRLRAPEIRIRLTDYLDEKQLIKELEELAASRSEEPVDPVDPVKPVKLLIDNVDENLLAELARRCRVIHNKLMVSIYTAHWCMPLKALHELHSTGHVCHECFCVLPSSHGMCCGACALRICSDCAVQGCSPDNQGCGDVYCKDCLVLQSCACCERKLCRSCNNGSTPCKGCSKKFCMDCLGKHAMSWSNGDIICHECIQDVKM